MAEEVHKHWSMASKGIFSFFLIFVALVLGYIAVYYWTFNDLGNVFSLQALRGQVISTQKASDVQDQLQELGFEVTDFFSLDDPVSSKTYKANVLNTFEPEEVEEDETPGIDSYYFYDDSGNAFYLTVDEEGKVDPESLVPLIVE